MPHAGKRRADAEDLKQETFIRWQQASDVEIKSPRALLVTILTRLCINHLHKRSPNKGFPKLVPTAGPLLRGRRARRRDGHQEYRGCEQNVRFPFRRSAIEANQRPVLGLYPAHLESPGTGFCVSFNYLSTGLAYVATSDLAETPGTARRLGIVNLVPGEAFGIGAVAFFRRSVMSSMRMPSKPRRIATIR
jgi:hypothetical protein